MDLNRVDILEIYQRFRDIRSGKAYDDENHSRNYEMQTSEFLRNALAQLLKYVESRVHNRVSVFDELQKLLSKLGAMVDSSEFSLFYEFVFFMCRENGQKNITVSKAIAAWRLVLVGRFRLLNQWCEFIQENQRHNISEDTWQQVLAFSRCVHENLEGYDPEGAWPVLVDDFVEHMYRLLGSKEDAIFFCDTGDSESCSCILDETLPGLKVASGLKRKLPSCEDDEMESSDILVSDCPNPNPTGRPKRNKMITYTQRSSNWEDNEAAGYSRSDCMEINQTDLSIGIFKSPCAIEGYLSRGFAGLFSSHSYLQFERERSASYT